MLASLGARFGAILAICWHADEKGIRVGSQVSLPGREMPQLKISEADHDRLISSLLPNEKTHIVNNVTEDGKWLVALCPFDAKFGTSVIELLVSNTDMNRINVTVEQMIEELEQCKKVLQDQSANENESSLNKQSNGEPAQDGSLHIQPKQYEAFSLSVHKSVDFSTTSDIVANEMRRVLDVDRVIVLRKKGPVWFVQSISGQTKVNRRSGLIKRLKELATKALATGKSFYYPGPQEPLPQISEPLRNYLDHCETRFIAIKPVHIKKRREGSNQDEAPSIEDSFPIAAIVVENYRNVPTLHHFEPVFDKYFEHCSLAFENAYRHRQLFLYPLWRTLGKSRLVLAARNIRKSVASMLILILVSTFLAVWPADFNVIANGKLVPTERRRVYAELEGIVVNVPVEHLEKVDKGTLLATVVNEDLEFQIEQVSGEIDELEQRLSAIQADRILRRGTEGSNSENNAKGIQTQLASLKKLMETLESKSNRLKISSPLEGTIITWDVKERLINRPVAPGELLMEVANVQGEWELVINVPSRKIGHVLRAEDQMDELVVTYAIASEPGTWRKGKVVSVESAARLQSDQSQTIALKVQIELDHKQYPANTGVVARVYCGRRSIGYVWVHDAWEYLQENVIFRIW